MRQLNIFLTPRRQGAKMQRFYILFPASWRLGVFALICFFCVSNLMAQSVTVSPSSVNVYSQGATSVLLTYGGLGVYRPAEATWCGALQPASPPETGFRCNPATLFGRLPARYNQSRLSGNSGYTDIMSVTPSVARRAYLDAAKGATATFFYVRRFTATNGGPDQFVPVTLRLTGNGAAAPLSLTNVKLGWGVNKSVLLVKSDETLPAVQAEINYTGTGRLIGRWEIVKPGEILPDNRDLLPEASLPREERGRQKRYTQLSRFNIFLPPNGKIALPVPEAHRLDRSLEGMYMVLLRVEASDDAQNQSEVAGAGTLSSGATAGFAMPTLRYYVGSGGLTKLDEAVLASREQIFTPAAGALVPLREPLLIGWPAVPDAVSYQLNIVTPEGRVLFGAVIMSDAQNYRAPSWLPEKLGNGPLCWRLTTFGPGRRKLQESRCFAFGFK